MLVGADLCAGVLSMANAGPNTNGSQVRWCLPGLTCHPVVTCLLGEVVHMALVVCSSVRDQLLWE